MWEKVFARIHALSLLIWMGFYGLALLILLSGSESMPWSLNQRVEGDVTARVAFAFVDESRAQEARQTARTLAPNVYVANSAPIDALQNELSGLLQLSKRSGEDAAALKKALAEEGWPADAAFIEAIGEFSSEEKSKQYSGLVKSVGGRLAAEYIVAPSDDAMARSPYKSKMVDDAGPQEIDTSKLRFLGDRSALAKDAQGITEEIKTCPAPLHAAFADRIVRVLMGPPESGASAYQPLWRFDETATKQEADAAEGRVEDENYLIKFGQGDVLVEAGTTLTADKFVRLEHAHRAFLERERVDPKLAQRRLWRRVGMGTVVLLVTCGLVGYMASYQRRILEKPARTLGLAGVMGLMILASRLMERSSFPRDLPVEFSVAFLVMAAALLTIAYNQRFALGAGSALAVLMVLACRSDLGLLVTYLVGLGITVFLLREVRTRSKLVAVGTLAAMGVFLASSMTDLMGNQDRKYVLMHAGAAAGSAFFAGFLVQGVLHYFERLFGIATSLTLLEWSDASQPLLRRLAQEAGGTYSHSSVLSQLAEAAAESIGVNGLLARVGALYHDVGKIPKSEYFVENQAARMNRHDRLSPTMSLLIIVGHVKDGLEMAKAYGLPRVLHQFIAEHHGTTVVKYFHHAASEAAASKNTAGRHDREVPESEFRYPGPKPRTKESAILMLCDCCESSVRALEEPTAPRIEGQVHQVVMDRLNDGQFDDCDITLRELHQVEQALVKSLCAAYHGRVKYPKGEPKKDESADDEKANGDGSESPPTPPSAEARQAREVAHQA